MGNKASKCSGGCSAPENNNKSGSNGNGNGNGNNKTARNRSFSFSSSVSQETAEKMKSLKAKEGRKRKLKKSSSTTFASSIWSWASSSSSSSSSTSGSSTVSDPPRQVAAYDGPEDDPIAPVIENGHSDDSSPVVRAGCSFGCFPLNSKKDNKQGEKGDEDLRPREATFWLTDIPMAPNTFAQTYPIDEDDEEDKLDELDVNGDDAGQSVFSSNKKNITPQRQLTTFRLKAIESDRLPILLYGVQTLDEYLVASFSDDPEGPIYHFNYHRLPKRRSHYHPHRRNHYRRHDEDHYLIPKSAFVKVILTEEQSSLYQFNSGFLTSADSGQILKIRLADGAYFLSYYSMTPKEEEEKIFIERMVDLELVEEKMGNGSKNLQNTTTLKVLSRTNSSSSFFKFGKNRSKAAAAAAAVAGPNSKDPSSSAQVPLQHTPKFTAIKISDKDTGVIGGRLFLNHHRYQLSTHDVAIYDVPLGTLLRSGVLYILSQKEGRITLNFAPWLGTEKYLPMVKGCIFTSGNDGNEED